MSKEGSGGGASVGTSDRSGGNNRDADCRYEISQLEGSSNQGFSEEEKKWFASFDEVSISKKSNDNINSKIQKVPSMLRDNRKFETYFQPKVFSLGPAYHHPFRTNQMAKKIKLNLSVDFFRQNSVIKETLYGVIKDRINILKDCYDSALTEEFIEKDTELAQIFLVDGCAILQFMYISVDFQTDPEKKLKQLEIKTDYAEFLAQDLFLLENQLPYQLLQLIIQQASSKQNKLLESIYKFIFYRFRTPEEWDKDVNKILEDRQNNHVHLLDLLRKQLIQPRHQRFEIGISCISIPLDKLKRNKALVPFRNTGKLRETGINLKCSKTSCVNDISFSGGTLKLPRIIVGESTTRMFLNMLGYEMCPDFHNQSEVSTYMYIMDKLIDRTQDVEELREKNILLNQLGCDEDVVKLFNEISTHLIPNDEYYKVKRNIDNYFDNRVLMWLHKISHDIHQYFKRRWSILAFIGALLAVVSGIFQSVITFLAYQVDSKKGN